MIAEKLRKAVLQAAIQGKLLSLENVEYKTVYFDNQEFEIPANWQCVKIGELGSFQRGKGINRSQIVKKGFPAVRYGELYTTYDLFIDEVVSFVPANIHSKSYKINYGDILFTLTGETDIDIAKSVSYLCDEPASFGGDLAAWMNHNQDPKYLSYALSSPFLIRQKAKSATGNIIVHSSVKKISNMMIILPPLEEQKRIVEKLEVLLAEIDELEKFENELKMLEENFPTSLWKSILKASFNGNVVDFEMDDTPITIESTNTLFEDDVGNFTIKKLAEIANISTGKRDANHAKEQGKYRFYTCAQNYFMTDTFAFSGDSLILPGNGANVGKVYRYNGKFEAYQRTYVVQIKEEYKKFINMNYLEYLFLANWSDFNKDKMYGSATPYIKLRNLQNFPIIVPNIESQIKLVNMLDNLLAVNLLSV